MKKSMREEPESFHLLERREEEESGAMAIERARERERERERERVAAAAAVVAAMPNGVDEEKDD